MTPFPFSNMETYTITFGDVAENHTRMEQIGHKSDRGFTLNELQQAHGWFLNRGVTASLLELNSLVDIPTEPAYLLLIPNGLKALCNPDSFHLEQRQLEKDTKALMYGRVVNKHARHNLCFSDVGHEPNYEAGQGRVVSFDNVPILKHVRDVLSEIIPGEKLQAEGNYYYDVTKCGIGFHGDSERRKVIAIRTGASMSLHYQWYQDNNRIGTRGGITLNHGDMYS
jgi:hypothetical protein